MTNNAGQVPESAVSRPGGISGLLWLIRAAALIAFGVSCYLAWLSASGSLPTGCGGGSDCDDLLAGTWSKWFDVPVSFPAAVVYLGILLASLGAAPRGATARQRRSWGILAALAILAAGGAIWFIVLQLGIVHRFCPYCMAVHASGLVVAIGVLMGLQKLPAKRRDTGYRIVAGIRPQPVWALLLAGLAGVGVLIAGQALSSKPQLQVAFGNGDRNNVPASKSASRGQPASRQAPNPVATTSSTKAVAATSRPAEPPERSTDFLVKKNEETVPLDPNDLPIIGSPDAFNLLAIMSDYTCPICREMHPWLNRAVQRYGDQLAIIVLHVPLQKECNPRIKVTQKLHANACELARLSLAVWRVDRAAFLKMDNWLFEMPRKTEDARAFAVSLVGEETLKKGEADPWVKKTIARNVYLYDLDGGGAIPRILLTKVAKGGSINSEKQMYSMIEKEFDLHPVAPKPPVRATAPATQPATAPAGSGATERTPIPSPLGN